MSVYKAIFKPLLFSMEPEEAHHVTVKLLQWAAAFPGGSSVIKSLFSAPHAPVHTAGLTFSNPVGLAAGFDKNAVLMHEMALLGFGFIEIGTVTPRPQSGNPGPRMFRMPDDEALINRMGFNNDGMEAVAARLRKRPQHLIVGCNIGKNKDTPPEKAVDDYLACFSQLAPLTDYTTVNVSSPNTPGLRDLLALGPLKELLQALTEANSTLKKPLFLKLSPDMANEDIRAVTQLCVGLKINGIIATNTTVSRANLKTSETKLESVGVGGLSGKPLFDRSTEVLHIIKQELAGSEMTLIASGGIHTPEHASQKIAEGANLIQLYTGLVYEGPGLVREIVKAI